MGPWRPGRLAQLVEQLTLNQRVVGSIPTAPTNLFNDLARFSTNQKLTVYRAVYTFVRASSFMIAISASFASRPR